jgi:glycosyltransferase involved in cell wall biosynthesis
MDKRACMKKLGLDESRRYLCFSGSLSPWQGVEVLVPALHGLRSTAGDLNLLIVGDGELRSDLEAKARELGMQDSVRFCGYVPYEEVPTYLNSADICVAPFNAIPRNVKYGFSAIKLYEYMACGRPFVTTTVCGIGEEIRETDVGRVVEPDDPAQLQVALEELLKDGRSADEMGKRGRSLAEKEHSWVSVAKRTTGILEEVAR